MWFYYHFFLFLEYKIVSFLVIHPHIRGSTIRFLFPWLSSLVPDAVPALQSSPFCFYYIHTRKYKYVPTQHTPECGSCLPSQSPSLVLPLFPLALTLT